MAEGTRAQSKGPVCPVFGELCESPNIMLATHGDVIRHYLYAYNAMSDKASNRKPTMTAVCDKVASHIMGVWEMASIPTLPLQESQALEIHGLFFDGRKDDFLIIKKGIDGGLGKSFLQ